MPDIHPYSSTLEPTRKEITRAAAAIVILVGLFSLLFFARPLDPTKVAAGVPCSVLSEDEIGDVLGARMRLMPSSGNVCQYVSTTAGTSRTLFVIARRDPAIPTAHGTIELHGAGDAAVRADGAVYARFGRRSYLFAIAPDATDSPQRVAEELRLAKMVRPELVARR